MHTKSHSTVGYGWRLINSAIAGAVSGCRETIEKEGGRTLLWRAATDSWRTAAIGACLGAAASAKESEDPLFVMLKGGLIGGAVGLGAGILWNLRAPTGTALKSAMQNVNVLRDERWLERNPINYA